MSDPLFSSSWYRVAPLRPRLRAHARLHRHVYRGERWYVLQDPSSGRCHRLSSAAQHLIGLMDGVRTTDEIWQAAATQLGDDTPTQDETIRLLGLLHSADVLLCDVTPDTAEMFRRNQRRDSAESWRRFMSPLSQRFPLADPNAFLDRWLWLVKPLFSAWGAAAWCAVMLAAVALAGAHWAELTRGSVEELLDPRNLMILWLVYPCVKILHELGHAFAAKVWGCEVHEMGVMLLVLMPVAYVDASAAAVLSDKRKRMLVGAAGILVELFLAALAFFVWLSVEPGLVRSVAYNVIWIGGASALLFNGNPLLRYDGYYVLADAIEIPNLSGRSTQYLGYLAQRHLFGIRQARYPVTAPGEARWFVGYGVASFLYRLFVVFAIALFIAGKFLLVGVLLAVFSLVVQIVVPLARQGVALLTSSRYGSKRGRTVGVTAGVALGGAAVLLLLPVPLWTTAEGVVWLPDQAQVRAGENGFVRELLVEPNSTVQAGDALIRTTEPLLEAEVAVLEAQHRELVARHHAERRSDLVRAKITREEIATLEASLRRARERAGEVIIRSPTEGVFVLSQGDDLVGRFVRQGELVAYVVSMADLTVRVVVPQSDVALVRDRTERVGVRLSSRLERVAPAVIERHLPAATQRLPSRTIGTEGGGRWPVDPSDPEGLSTPVPVFQFDLALASSAHAGTIGERAYVRFDHGSEPLGMRSYRALRRLFLGRFGV